MQRIHWEIRAMATFSWPRCHIFNSTHIHVLRTNLLTLYLTLVLTIYPLNINIEHLSVEEQLLCSDKQTWANEAANSSYVLPRKSGTHGRHTNTRTHAHTRTCPCGARWWHTNHGDGLILRPFFVVCRHSSVSTESPRELRAALKFHTHVLLMSTRPFYFFFF